MGRLPPPRKLPWSFHPRSMSNCDVSGPQLVRPSTLEICPLRYFTLQLAFPLKDTSFLAAAANATIAKMVETVL